MALSKEIEDFVDLKLRENGFELVEALYLREGGRWVLRIFMDKLEPQSEQSESLKSAPHSGVTLEDCENMSEVMGRWLDTTPYFSQAYTLEISSPGVNRRLKTEVHFRKYVGQKVKLSLFAPMNEQSRQRNFSGVLLDCKDHSISVEDSTSGKVQIPLEKIAKAHLNII